MPEPHIYPAGEGKVGSQPPEMYARQIHTGTSTEPTQPPDPFALFPEADPQKQLELFTIAARLRVAVADNITQTYEKAESLPGHRLYSQAVQLCLDHHTGHPVARTELINHLARGIKAKSGRRAPWITTEAIAREWGKNFKKSARQAQHRARSIVPPAHGKTRAQKMRGEARMLREAAWERVQRLKLESETEANQAISNPAGQTAVGQPSSRLVMSTTGKDHTYISPFGQTVIRKLEDRPPTESEQKTASRTARKTIRSFLGTLAMDELGKGFIPLQRFPDIGLRRSIKHQSNACITANNKLQINESIIECAPELLLLLNALLLLRNYTPPHVADLSQWMGKTESEVWKLYGDTTRIANKKKSSLLSETNPYSDPTLGLPALGIHPAVSLIDVRGQTELQRAPQQIFMGIEQPIATKPASRPFFYERAWLIPVSE